MEIAKTTVRNPSRPQFDHGIRQGFRPNRTKPSVGETTESHAKFLTELFSSLFGCASANCLHDTFGVVRQI